jgi:diacylglycerol kinase (ATP)
LVALILLAAYIRATPTQWAALFLGATSIASAELLNTAVERLADFIRPQPDARIGLIKDLAAAAVLLAILSTTAAAGLVVWDRWGT